MKFWKLTLGFLRAVVRIILPFPSTLNLTPEGKLSICKLLEGICMGGGFVLMVLFMNFVFFCLCDIFTAPFHGFTAFLVGVVIFFYVLFQSFRLFPWIGKKYDAYFTKLKMRLQDDISKARQEERLSRGTRR